ncbi:MAG: lactate utilization protein [Deltaproteobacteria bacterium]|nr:lactate utilization protein [Deltaproteobacteria bacterium]
MDEHQIKYNEKLAEQVIKKISKRRMEASYAPTITQARDEVLGMIPAGVSVYRCGSMSLVEIGLWEALSARNDVTIIDPFGPQLKPEEAMAERVRGMSADFMVASSNALTSDGKLVNLDGVGNRVAAMCFGPKKVILIVGMNKIAPDLDSAMARVKHQAAPINNIRLNKPNPCVETGLCHDCSGPARICNMWSIIEGHLIENRIHVKLVGQSLGY